MDSRTFSAEEHFVPQNVQDPCEECGPPNSLTVLQSTLHTDEEPSSPCTANAPVIKEFVFPRHSAKQLDDPSLQRPRPLVSPCFWERHLMTTLPPPSSLMAQRRPPTRTPHFARSPRPVQSPQSSATETAPCHQATSMTRSDNNCTRALDDRMPEVPLPSSLTEAYHVSTLSDQPPSSLTAEHCHETPLRKHLTNAATPI